MIAMARKQPLRKYHKQEKRLRLGVVALYCEHGFRLLAGSSRERFTYYYARKQDGNLADCGCSRKERRIS
jgi:hypothetical protein